MLGPGGIKFSPHASVRPRTSAVEDEEVSLPGVLVCAQLNVILLSDTRHAAPSPYLSAHAQIVMYQVPPHCHVVHAGSQNELCAGCKAAC
jgi:hypothetical protein